VGSGATSAQPRRSLNGPINRCNRMHRSRLSLDFSRLQKFDDDCALALTADGGIFCQRHVYRAYGRVVRGERGEEPVLGVRALVVGWSVGTRYSDLHRPNMASHTPSAAPRA